MKQVITGLAVQVEITRYTEDGKKAGLVLAEGNKPPVFSVAEADIPEPVLEWVRQVVGMKGVPDA